MILEAIASAPAGKPSDDAFGARIAHGALHAWVIDGATSVADPPDRVVRGLSDAAWFARGLSAGLHRAARQGGLTPGRLSGIVAALAARFHAAAPDAPLHAHPVAALTAIRLSPAPGGWRLDVHEQADCFVAVLPPGPGHPLRRPLPPRLPPVALDRGPTLDRLRRRRAKVVAGGVSSALTIRPASVAAARRWTAHLPRGTRLLLGSDGLARPWTEYALTEQPAALAHIARTGLLDALARLRAWEAAHFDHGTAPKPADDTTALLIAPDAPPSRGHLRHHAGTLHWRAAPTGRATLAQAEALSHGLSG